jgi:hypothetical protein
MTLLLYVRIYMRVVPFPVRLPGIGVLIADGEVGSHVVDADHGAVPDVAGQQRPRDLGLDVAARCRRP